MTENFAVTTGRRIPFRAPELDASVSPWGGLTVRSLWAVCVDGRGRTMTLFERVVVGLRIRESAWTLSRNRHRLEPLRMIDPVSGGEVQLLCVSGQSHWTSSAETIGEPRPWEPK